MLSVPTATSRAPALPACCQLCPRWDSRDSRVLLALRPALHGARPLPPLPPEHSPAGPRSAPLADPRLGRAPCHLLCLGRMVASWPIHWVTWLLSALLCDVQACRASLGTGQPAILLAEFARTPWALRMPRKRKKRPHPLCSKEDSVPGGRGPASASRALGAAPGASLGPPQPGGPVSRCGTPDLGSDF